MILRKPYAFFIKMFKPLHIVLAIIVSYLMYIQNDMLKVFNSYLHNINVTQTYQRSILLFLIPIILIFTYIIIFGIMYKKNKPTRFYIVSIFTSLIVAIINIYGSNYALILVNQTVPIKTVKLVSDLVLINVFIEAVTLAFLVVRGLGIDIKKFDFSSDLLNIDISDSDRQEFELNINVDVDLEKRIRRGRIRNLKYLYKENKLLINLIIFVIAALIPIAILLLTKVSVDVKPMNYSYYTYNFSFKVNASYIIDSDFKGNDIDNLLVLAVDMKSDNQSNVRLDDFSLSIGETNIKPTKNYNNLLKDLGNVYDERKLEPTYSEYLLVFKLPEKYSDNKIFLKYQGVNNGVKIKVSYERMNDEIKKYSSAIGETIKIENLNNLEFRINDYDIQNKYTVNYNYCYKETECVSSIEYLRPSIDENFDKIILRLSVDFSSDENSNIKGFYKLLSTYGSIEYENGSQTYIQKGDFEEIKSKKSNTKNVYIGVNNLIQNSEHIKIILSIRNSTYEYVLK